jgi:transposase
VGSPQGEDRFSFQRPSPTGKEDQMSKTVNRRCCGLDIHKDTVVVCVLPPDGTNSVVARKTYGTFRNDLTRMRGWLKQLHVTEIAMESTGVYWWPVWNVLEGQGFRLLLVNPAQVKALQGRKSDKRDAKRIAEFLQDGRLDASFVPPPEIRHLRQLTRHRLSLLQQRTEVHNQIRDLLETASVKLSSVASDLLGVSGRRIIEAMIAGEDSPELLSGRLRGSLQKKKKLARESLKGYFNDFHRLMLDMHYRHYEFISKQIQELEMEITGRMEPYSRQITLLMGIPGVERVVAWHLIAELGADMSVFPDADHCASWAGVCPGSCESAGKQLSTRTKKGNKYLRRVLTQAAWAVSHCKHGYLRAFFYRVKARRGWGKAIMAVAHKILVFAYCILKTGTPYQDLGDNYFDNLHPERVAQRLLQRLQQLGLEVTVAPSKLLNTDPPSASGG